MELSFLNIVIVVGAAALLGAFVEEAGRRQERVLTEKLAVLERKLDEVLARHG